MARVGSVTAFVLWAGLAGWALASGGCGEDGPPAGGSSPGGSGSGISSGGAGASGGQGSGAAGAGASGGAGGTVPTGGWQPVPWLASCAGERLDLASESWPARGWASCGAGCLEASAVNIPGQAIASRDASGATVIDGEIHYRTSTHANDLDYDVIERLSDGAVLFVLRFAGQCLAGGGKTDAPYLIEVARDIPEPGLEIRVGRLDPVTGVLEGAGPLPLSDYQDAWFTFEGGWGVVDANRVQIALDPSMPELTTIHTASTWQWPARARGELVAWVDWAVVPSPIRSWTAAGGKQVLVSQPWDIASVGLGEEIIAWIGATGPMTGSGQYDTARLYWSPWTTDPVAVVVSEGPDLTGYVLGGLELVVAGDYVAVNGIDIGASLAGVLVVRRSTLERWFIPPRPGTGLVPVAISPTEILATETDEASHGSNFDRYLRLELASLDTLAQGWPAP